MARLPSFCASIVIPAYNEGARLPPFLEELLRLGLEREARPVEFLVVDDGSSEGHLANHRQCVAGTSQRLERAGSRHRVRLIEGEKNQGKGAAICLGWREASAESAWLGFLDADGAVPAAEFWRLLGQLGDHDDVLAGARILMGGRHIRRSLYRHLQGRVFATLTELAFHLGFYDTQCGVKFVRSAALRPHLHLLRERGWLLDIEVLGLVHRQGGRLREEPIDWADPGGSKVRFGIDAIRMMLGLRRISRNLDRWVASGELCPLSAAPELAPLSAPGSPPLCDQTGGAPALKNACIR